MPSFPSFIDREFLSFKILSLGRDARAVAIKRFVGVSISHLGETVVLETAIIPVRLEMAESRYLSWSFGVVPNVDFGVPGFRTASKIGPLVSTCG